MTQQGEAGAAAATMTSEPAQQAASQSQSLPPQGQQSQQTAEDFIRVPRTDPVLAEFGHRWGEVGKAAKQYRQAEQSGVFKSHGKAAELAAKYGYESVDEYLDAVDAYVAAQQQAGTQQQQVQQGVPADPEDQPLTVKQWKALQAQEQEAAQKQASERQRHDWFQAETRSMVDTLEKVGFKAPPDGQKSPRFQLAMTALDQHVRAIKEEAFTPYPQLSDKLNERNRAEHMSRPATAAQLAEAAKRFADDWKDISNESIAAFAQSQTDNVPPNSMGGGPAGRQPPTSIHDLPPDQRKAEVMRQQKQLLAQRGYRPQ